MLVQNWNIPDVGQEDCKLERRSVRCSEFRDRSLGFLGSYKAGLRNFLWSFPYSDFLKSISDTDTGFITLFGGTCHCCSLSVHVLLGRILPRL